MFVSMRSSCRKLRISFWLTKYAVVKVPVPGHRMRSIPMPGRVSVDRIYDMAGKSNQPMGEIRGDLGV